MEQAIRYCIDLIIRLFFLYLGFFIIDIDNLLDSRTRERSFFYFSAT